MLLNLTHILTEKFTKNFKLNDILNFYNIDKHADFICVARIYSMVPTGMIKNSYGKPEITFEAKPLTEDEYILFLRKVDNHEVIDLSSGVKLSTNLNSTSKFFDLGDGPYLSYYEDSPLCIKMELVLENNARVSKKINRLFEGNTEMYPSLTEIQSKAKRKFINQKDELFKNSFCGTDLEKRFFIDDYDQIEQYKEMPKVGDYFGYVGPINHIVPRNNIYGQSDLYSFESCSLDENPRYPFIFKRISEDTVIEVISKTKYCFSHFLSGSNLSNKYEDKPLHVKGTDYIVLNDFFKKEYVHLVSDLVAYESWVLNQRENATSSYKTKMLELEERENEKINEAYEMAQIDNMMFDLDRELKKTNDNE